MALLALVEGEALLVGFVGLCFFVGIVASVSESAGSTWAMLSVKPVDRVEASGQMLQRRVSGNLLAPIVGGTLYSIGGFALPFLVGATAFLVFVILAKSTLLQEFKVESEGDDKNPGSILKIPIARRAIAVFFLVISFMFAGQVWMNPLLHFNYQYSFFAIGIFNSIGVIPFAIGATSIGALQKKVGYFKAIYIGVIPLLIGSLMMGPSPFVTWLIPQPSPSTWFVPVISNLLMAFTVGVMLAVCQPICVNAAVNAGFPEYQAAAQMGSTTILAAGASLGVAPLVAGPAVAQCGVGPWSTGVGAFYLFAIIPLFMSMEKIDAASEVSIASGRRKSEVPSEGQ